MKNINLLNKKQLNKIDKHINFPNISEQTNKILEENKQIDNEKRFFKKLDFLLQKWKTLYKTSKSIKQKEQNITTILKNITYLFNNLYIKRVHNSSKSLNKDYYNYENIEQLKEWFRIRWKNFLEDNKIGFSCNNLNIWLYWLINNITNNDKQLKITFELNKNDNHWKLIININNNNYIIDSNSRWIYLKKYKKNILFKKIENIEKYKKEFVKWQESKNIITYNYWKYQIQFINTDKIIIFLFRDKPIKSTKFYWLKKLYKNYQKFLVSKKIFYKKWRFKTIQNLEKFIQNKFNNNNAKIIIQALKNIEPEKIKNFL